MPTEMIALLVVGAFALLFIGGYAVQKNNDRESEIDASKTRKDTENVWTEIARRTGMKLLQKSPHGLALHGMLDSTGTPPCE